MRFEIVGGISIYEGQTQSDSQADIGRIAPSAKPRAKKIMLKEVVAICRSLGPAWVNIPRENTAGNFSSNVLPQLRIASNYSSLTSAMIRKFCLMPVSSLMLQAFGNLASWECVGQMGKRT